MKNELISSNKNSVFAKIKNLFLKLFLQKENNNELDCNEENNYISDEKSFENDIKVEVDNSEIYQNIEKEKFIEEIEKDDTILEKLSLERLKILEKYYEEKVEEKEKILKCIVKKLKYDI